MQELNDSMACQEAILSANSEKVVLSAYIDFYFGIFLFA